MYTPHRMSRRWPSGHDHSVVSPSESVSDNPHLAPGEDRRLPLPTHLSVRQLLAHQTQESKSPHATQKPPRPVPTLVQTTQSQL